MADEKKSDAWTRKDTPPRRPTTVDLNESAHSTRIPKMEKRNETMVTSALKPPDPKPKD